MDVHNINTLEIHPSNKRELPYNVVWVDHHKLFYLTERISHDQRCRYPQLTLRILINAIAGMDTDGKIYICARQLSKIMDVHYDTVTKCIKYLREIEVLRIER